MSTVIKCQNVSKLYQLGNFSSGSFSQDFSRWWSMTLGKDDPFLKIGENNVKNLISKSNIIWSLKDINFEIKAGEKIGIIGKNGAGKSTLLKVLSQITSPSTGKINIKGRIASLLEVGTGFHPELTGRENIFLNGAILGMRKNEIKKKLDEIIQFSGIEKYIDTPVKRYSSGMYVRLAFSVGAHLQSEILIVDEVLAVGDAEFQKQCLGKMNDVSNSEGRTILFVSHNMNAIEKLCNKSILLENGYVTKIDDTKNVMTDYLTQQNTLSLPEKELSINNNSASFKSICFKNSQNEIANQFNLNDIFYLELSIDIFEQINGMELTVSVTNSRGTNVIFSNISDCVNIKALDFSIGLKRLKITFPSSFLIPDIYNVRISAHISGSTDIDTREDIATFKINPENDYRNYGWSNVLSNTKWEFI